jgi:thioredoxin-dependent peroxiredoxin
VPMTEIPLDRAPRRPLLRWHGTAVRRFRLPTSKEAIDFSRLRRAFARCGTDILGVSADPVASLDRFKSKHKLTIALASDEKHKALRAYGVWREKSLYGRKFMGIVRATFLIGPDQRIARVWPKVSVAGHAEEVLATAKAL